MKHYTRPLGGGGGGGGVMERELRYTGVGNFVRVKI